MKRLVVWFLVCSILCAILLIGLRYGGIYLYYARIAKEQAQIAERVEDLPIQEGEMILFSLNPYDRKGYSTNTENVFHGFSILGKTPITNPKDRERLIGLLAADIRNSRGIVAMCFNPRHGLRVSKGSKIYDFSICFECMQVYPYNFNADKTITISGDANDAYNAFLERYGLEKAKE